MCSLQKNWHADWHNVFENHTSIICPQYKLNICTSTSNFLSFSTEHFLDIFFSYLTDIFHFFHSSCFFFVSVFLSLFRFVPSCCEFICLFECRSAKEQHDKPWHTRFTDLFVLRYLNVCIVRIFHAAFDFFCYFCCCFFFCFCCCCMSWDLVVIQNMREK